MTDSLMKEISDWQNSVFPPSRDRIRGLFNHLQEEVTELGMALFLADWSAENESIKKAHHEGADVFFILNQIMDAIGVGLEKPVREKLEINKKRTWGAVNAAGIINHVEDSNV